MKITKTQLQQIIKEELNAFLDEAFDDPKTLRSNAWDNKEIEPFSRANMFIRSAEAEDFLDEGSLALAANEIAKSIFEQMLQDQNLPKHAYIEKIKKDVKNQLDQPFLLWDNFTRSAGVPRAIERLKKIAGDSYKQLKAVELFEKYHKILKLLMSTSNELDQKLVKQSRAKAKNADLRDIAFTDAEFKKMAKEDGIK